MQQLYGWLGLTGFTRSVGATMAGEVKIEYQQPKWEKCSIGNGKTVEFGVGSNYSTQAHSQSISEEAGITFSSDTGMNLDAAWNMTTAMRTLLHFASLRRVYTVNMKLGGVSENGETETDPREKTTVWAMGFREMVTEPAYSPEWVFQLKDLTESLGSFFGRWLEYARDYDECIGCYTTTIYHSLPTPIAHLCLTQALDAYHGVRHGSHGQRNFKNKVEELCETHEKSLSDIIEHPSRFAKVVRDTRDYFTHRNPDDLEKREVVERSAELIRLNERLSILFQSCVLTDMGIPSDRLGNLRRQIARSIVEY